MIHLRKQQIFFYPTLFSAGHRLNGWFSASSKTRLECDTDDRRLTAPHMQIFEEEEKEKGEYFESDRGEMTWFFLCFVDCFSLSFSTLMNLSRVYPTSSPNAAGIHRLFAPPL